MDGSIVASRPGRRSHAALRRAAVFAALVLAAVAFGAVIAARAGEMTPAESTVAGPASVLDGLVFSGEIGVLGKGPLSTDTWVFEDGTFLSEKCLECGFPRGLYSTRRDGDGIAFEAETPCPRTDAKLVWRGTVENGRIEGVYTWTKKRWYRTIEKEFWFKGTLGRREQAASGS